MMTMSMSCIIPGPRDKHDDGEYEPSHLVQEMSMMAVSMRCITPGPRDEHDDGEYALYHTWFQR